MKDPRDEIIQKFFKWLFLGDINELRECKAMIDEYEKNKEEKEETTQEIDARFLRWKQDEIDSLRKEAERQKWKADKYSNLYAEQVEKYEELEKDLKTAQDWWESRDRIISKIYSLIEYRWLSDVKKIEIIRKVIKADNWEIEPDQDVKDFHSMKYRNKWLQN